MASCKLLLTPLTSRRSSANRRPASTWSHGGIGDIRTAGRAASASSSAFRAWTRPANSGGTAEPGNRRSRSPFRSTRIPRLTNSSISAVAVMAPGFLPFGARSRLRLGRGRTGAFGTFGTAPPGRFRERGGVDDRRARAQAQLVAVAHHPNAPSASSSRAALVLISPGPRPAGRMKMARGLSVKSAKRGCSWAFGTSGTALRGRFRQRRGVDAGQAG
jgi:hypothetical protein